MYISICWIEFGIAGEESTSLTGWCEQAYDSHCNLVLGDVEETVYVVDEEDDEATVRTVKKQSEMLFVRGMEHPHAWKELVARGGERRTLGMC